MNFLYPDVRILEPFCRDLMNKNGTLMEEVVLSMIWKYAHVG